MLCIGLFGAIVPFFSVQIWWVRAWTYARLQVLALILILGAAHVLLFGLNPLFMLGVFVVVGCCLFDILPFTPLGPKQSFPPEPGQDDVRVSLLCGNVLMENDKAEGLISQIEAQDPDIVFLVETDAAWRERLRSVETRYPFNHLLPLPDFNGMLLYSKHPIDAVVERRLIQDHIPSLRVDLHLEEGTAIRLFGVHPRPPRPQDATEDMDAELMLVAEQAANSPLPTLVMGDLNDVGWSPTTKTFLHRSGLRDPRRGRGLFNTYNAKNPLVRWPLDHIFHSHDFALIDIQRLEKYGSDHFPITATFALDRTARA